MSIHNQLPEHLRTQVNGPVLFSAQTDLLPDGRFGEQWVVVTAQEITVWSQEGVQTADTPMAQIGDTRAVGAVGGGALIADTHEGPVVIARYTAGLTTVFGFAARLVSALAKDEERPTISEKDFPHNCPSCGNPLGEGTRVCQLCMKGGKVAARMLRYAKPYKGRLAVAAVLLVLTTLVELIPPYLNKIMIDDVLQPKNLGSTLILVITGLWVTTLLTSSRLSWD